jgi:hypothetical protein
VLPDGVLDLGRDPRAAEHLALWPYERSRADRPAFGQLRQSALRPRLLRVPTEGNSRQALSSTPVLEEMSEQLRREVGVLLGEEMPARNRLTADVSCPSLPDRKRAARIFVPRCQSACRAPERQDRTLDAPTRVEINFIVGAINACRSAILLADRMCVSGISQRVDVGFPDIRRKRVSRAAPMGQGIVDHRIRRRRKKTLP